MAKRRAQKTKVTYTDRVDRYLATHPNAKSLDIAKALKLTIQQVYSARTIINKRGLKFKAEPKQQSFQENIEVVIKLPGHTLTFDADTIAIDSDTIRILYTKMK